MKDSCLVCRPRLLFQYLPYIQQDALQLDAPDVEAVLEATCGGGGAAGGQSSIWGVMLSPCCVKLQASITIGQMSSHLCPSYSPYIKGSTQSWNASLLAAT